MRYAAALLADLRRAVTHCRIVGHRWDMQQHHGNAARLCVRCAAIEWHRP
jgi:hypothetical protein